MTPAHRIPPASLVNATLDGVATPCLKVERAARDYVNHYLIPLAVERRRLALVYIDPDTPLSPVAGTLELGERSGGYPDIGDAFVTPAGIFLKLLDDPKAQKVFAYVDLATGQVRPRMERRAAGLIAWTIRMG